MCGPSGASEQLAGSAQSLSSIASANYNQRFQDQSGVLQSLNNILTPIATAGPNQEGFNAAEKSALNTQAINSSGAASKNAIQSIQGSLAGRGGDSGLVSGVDQQIEASVKSNQAGNLANAQNNIVQQDYAQGNKNWQEATAGLNSLSGDYQAAQFGQQATADNANAFQETDTIQQEKNQEQADIAGGITSLAMQGATMGLTAGGVGGFGKN